MNDFGYAKCPFRPHELMLAYTIVDWFIGNSEKYNYDKSEKLESLKSDLFNIAYKDLSLKPIGKCSKEELLQEIERRKQNGTK